MPDQPDWRDEIAASPEPWSHPTWRQWITWAVDSHHRWTGRSLHPEVAGDLHHALYHAPFVLVSHGYESDPILCYGNQAALKLWEMDLAQFLRTPSRHTAEPVHRDERARLLERTTRDGYVDDYQGIRVSSTGRRFQIHQATVWNVVNDAGEYQGQAATFNQWTPLGVSH